MPNRPTHLALAALALVATAAHADPADLDLPGPGSRSFVTTSVSYHKARFDSVDRSTGEPFGRTTSSTRSLDLQGRIALHERVNVEVRAGRSLTRSTANLTLGSFSGKYDQNHYGAGVTARPLGSATDPGFGLVLSLDADHTEGSGDTSTYVSAQPQFRFSPTVLAGLELGAFRGDDDRGQRARALMVWKASPRLSVIPALAWTRFEPGSGQADTHALSASLGMAYHLDERLSVITTWTATRNRDQDVGTMRAVDFRAYSVEAGLRYAF